MRLSAQLDMQQIAGQCFGAYSVQDMTVASQSNMHVGAHGSVQVGAGAHMQVNGQTLQVESGSTLNIDGPKVSLNEGPAVKNLPQVKQAKVDAPPAAPPDPTFATPHP